VDAAEPDRRVTALVHTDLLAAVGVYGLTLLFFRIAISPDAAGLEADRPLFAILACLSLAQYTGAWLLGRRLLAALRPAPKDRVRFFFLLRAAAAEAIAVYGFVLGFLGGSAGRVLILFALGISALLSCRPGPEAWSAALRRAEGAAGGPQRGPQ
jgi:hypothetical protein